MSFFELWVETCKRLLVMYAGTGCKSRRPQTVVDVGAHAMETTFEIPNVRAVLISQSQAKLQQCFNLFKLKWQKIDSLCPPVFCKVASWQIEELKLQKRSVDVVMANMSLHSVFRAKQDLADFLSFLDRTLCEGGYFVGLLLDTDQFLMHLESAQDTKTRVIQSSLATLELDKESSSFWTEKKNLGYGCKFSLTWNDAIDSDPDTTDPKFLVNWDLLCASLRHHGYRFVDSQFLGQWGSQLSKEHKSFADLFRTFVFQRMTQQL